MALSGMRGLTRDRHPTAIVSDAECASDILIVMTCLGHLQSEEADEKKNSDDFETEVVVLMGVMFEAMRQANKGIQTAFPDPEHHTKQMRIFASGDKGICVQSCRAH